MKARPSDFTSLNPCDGSVVWRGPAAGNAEIDDAVRRAREAFNGWSRCSEKDRRALLRGFAGVLASRRAHLAETIAGEIGKPLPEALGEVDAMAAKVDISIRAHEERCSTFKSGPALTRFRPHGLVAVLGPYNFPGHLPNGHIVPALLAGNTVVFKPSERAPATAEATLACWREAGLPAPVLQVLQGGPETSRLLTAHPGLDGLFFTGSATTGRILARQFADTPGKILALEMGGNNPLIVDQEWIDDLNTAAFSAIRSAFISTGQRCTCARRLILVGEGSAERFLGILLREAGRLTVGDPFADPAPFMGPLASEGLARGVLEQQEELLQAGAMPLLRAERLPSGKAFLSPGILDVTGLSDPPDEEIFGPLLQVYRAPDLDAAIAIANATRFGLAAGIITGSEDRWHHAFERLRAGIINWNAPLTGASSAAPFGGIGDSGNLRPSAFFAADYCSYPVASIEQPGPGSPG